MKGKVCFRFLVIFCCLGIFLSSLTGCEPLRKKFTRQKKKDKKAEEFIPVLDPIDYGIRKYTAEERYRHHFSLWQVWDRELSQSVGMRENNTKQFKYLVGQQLGQLEEMKKWLNDEKDAELDVAIKKLKVIEQEFNRPESMWDFGSIQRRLHSISGQIRDGFRPHDLQGYFIAD